MCVIQLKAFAAGVVSRQNIDVVRHQPLDKAASKSLAGDILAATQSAAMYMKELHLQIAQYLQYNYLIIVEVANRAADINRHLNELQVPIFFIY